MKNLFGNHINLVSRVLDLRLERQNIVMGNLANIKTPGYRARRLDFEDQLKASLGQNGAPMARTNEHHLPVALDKSIDPEMKKENHYQVVQGQDAVDLDKEMAIMSKNTMLYNALATVLKGNFAGMKKIISEGAR